MDANENTRVIRRLYRSIQTGDMAAFRNSLAEDVEWTVPEMESVPFAGVWTGREGDKVVALGRFVQRIKSTGREARSNWAHVWTVRDGRVVRFREYVDTAAVIRAHSG